MSPEQTAAYEAGYNAFYDSVANLARGGDIVKYGAAVKALHSQYDYRWFTQGWHAAMAEYTGNTVAH